MNVYLVFKGYPYEGETLLEIYDNLDAANMLATQETNTNGDYYKWVNESTTDEAHFINQHGDWVRVDKREV